MIALVRWFGMRDRGSGETSRRTPLEILQERYARGEIEREEYEQKRRDLEQQIEVRLHSEGRPIREIARLTRERGIVLHTDAAQSAGKLALDVNDLGVDMLTLAGHKFYAPKGVGALYARSGTPIRSVLHGAEQEHGLRPGTENVASIVALGAAAVAAQRLLPTASEHMRELRDHLHRRLAAAIPELKLNGHPEHRLPNTLHVSLPGVSGRALLGEAADAVAASVGSACHSEHDAVSGVLAALGADVARAAGAVRLSVGRGTTLDEVERAAEALACAWQQIHTR